MILRMIHYHEHEWMMSMILRRRGSVIPRALLSALPSAAAPLAAQVDGEEQQDNTNHTIQLTINTL
eukprot:3028474-Heterocapsa_arctica.AAC.1